MLAGLWFLTCLLVITGPALLFVGTMAGFGWTRTLDTKPRTLPPSLIVLTVALVPDLVMLVNLFAGFRIIHVMPNSDNVPLFSTWQILSGILIALALSLSLFQKGGTNKATLQACLILLLIHGTG